MAETNNKGSKPGQPNSKVKSGLAQFWEGMVEFFRDLTDLKKGQDREGTIVNIKNNMRMRGSNAWLLMCSIMIASLGLDLNSPAIIIGAMLISPLMSPILGVGLAIGINDRNVLSISLSHFGVAIAIALVTSTFYFYFTPIGEMTNEIVSRTAPTLLDAFVAFFGGVAGIISGTRKDKSNAIPGVAIATALMPPLCVTGFGIAHLIRYGRVSESFQTLTHLNNWEIILNSFYLFFLNATLVALATFLIVRLLRFPSKAFKSLKEERRTYIVIFGFSLILLIPSITILQGVLKDINSNNQVKRALQSCFGKDQKYVDDWKKIKTEIGYDLLVKVYGPTVSRDIPEIKEKLTSELPGFGTIEIIPSTDINLSKFKVIEAQFSEVERLDSIINKLIVEPQTQQDIQIAQLQNEIKKLNSDSLIEHNIKKGIMALYQDYIEEVNYYNYPIDTLAKKYPMLSIRWKNKRPVESIEKRVVEFVKTMSGKEVLKVSYEK